jgi:hypothetical protein
MEAEAEAERRLMSVTRDDIARVHQRYFAAFLQPGRSVTWSCFLASLT